MSSQELPSPQKQLTYGQDSQRERRNPSITPRKFNRFFTPRSQGYLPSSTARQALHDVTRTLSNRDGIQSSPLRPTRNATGQENGPTAFTRDLKRRKLLHIPNPMPEHTCLEKHLQSPNYMVIQDRDSEAEYLADIPSSPSPHVIPYTEYVGDERGGFSGPTKRIIPMEGRGLAGQLCQFSIGNSTRPRRWPLLYPVHDWQDETAPFYSRPADVHLCRGIDGPDRCIPFCTTSCNTNTLVAVGDEEGRVRLLESAKEGKPDFKDVFLAFRVHTNAIIDMAFSQDDSLLATASGDQSARIVDMATQTTLSVLGNHSASLKQVRFQPGATNNSVLATSSRDGSVQIWDLRCKGSVGSMQHIHPPVELNAASSHSAARKVTYGCAIHSIYDAHRPPHQTRQPQLLVPSDAPSRGEVPGRIGDVSVTAIAFLGPGQEHLLLTASEADASVKLWDIRSLHSSRRKTTTPLSCTKQPQSHSQWRHFGISSLNLSADGSRLYTLCKDNTVYTYSTSHLILGHAPELSVASQERRRLQGDTREGLGPIYGFRHPQLHAASFYVKSAVRKAKDGKSEMLAVGSSDGCAILFPTDERYLARQEAIDLERKNVGSGASLLLQRPHLRRTESGLLASGRLDDSILISQNGTALIRGHDREVGSLTWTSDGDLITVGDDFLIRCWREGPDARDLRARGEEAGRRWGCGWADVSGSYDDDDD